MKNEIVKIIPEINLIQDDLLKEKVINTIEDALKLGKWELNDLDSIPFTLLIPDTKVSLIDHTRNVTKTAVAVFDVLKESYKDLYPLDKDTLVAGAVLHDIGKFLEYEKDENGKIVKSESGKLLRHPISGLGLAFKHDLPEKVGHCIAYHAKEGQFANRIPESVIIHHADFMNFEPIRDWAK